MNESTSGWLTVSQAADVLGISERQARRYAGRLAPDDRREAGHEAGHMTGALVRLKAMAAEREKATKRTQKAASTLRPDASADVPTDTTPDMRPDTKPIEAGHVAGHVAADDDRRIIEILERENAFLKSQIEAANRATAEAHAALREALKMSSRALPESTLNEAVESPASVESTSNVQTPVAPEIVQQRQTERKALQPWQRAIARILGIR